MDDPSGPVSAPVRAARSMNRQSSVEDTLQATVDAARNSVPGFEHVGISTVDEAGQVHTRAATGPLVWELDRLQYEIGQGPCVSALRASPVVAVPDVRHEHRWPDYVPRAVALGLRSQLAVRLFLDDEGTMGSLNLYSTSRDDIDPGTEAAVDLFAAHAANALGRARERAHLNQALESRKVIGQAIGIVMERYGLDEDRAFAFLLRGSSHTNTKLRDVATDLVQQLNMPPARPGRSTS